MLKNVIANWAEIFFTIISVFVLYPFLVGTLGKEQYGIWLLITAVTGYLTLLHLGIPLATVRHISKYRAQGKTDDVNRVIGSSLVLYLCMAAVVTVAGVITSFALERVFKIPDQYEHVARYAVLIATTTAALNFPFEVLEGVMTAVQDFVILAAIKVGLVVTRVALCFLLVTNENGLLVIAGVLLSVAILQALLLFLYIRRKHPEISLSPRHFNTKMLKEILGYSLFVLLFQVASRLAFQTDPMVIGSVISSGAIVYFSVGNNFLNYLMQFVRGISRALVPKSSELSTKGGLGALASIYQSYSQLTFLFVLPACVLFMTIGDDFIAIWMGEEFREPSGAVLRILTPSYLLFLVQRGVGHPILMGIARVKFPTIVMALSSLANVGVSIIWGIQYGLNGVAWGTALPNIVNAAVMVVYTCRVLNVTIRRYLIHSLLKPSLSIAFILPPALVLDHYVRLDGYLLFFAVALSCCAIYGFGVHSFFLENEHKRRIARAFSRNREPAT